MRNQSLQHSPSRPVTPQSDPSESASSSQTDQRTQHSEAVVRANELSRLSREFLADWQTRPGSSADKAISEQIELSPLPGRSQSDRGPRFIPTASRPTTPNPIRRFSLTDEMFHPDILAPRHEHLTHDSAEQADQSDHSQYSDHFARADRMDFSSPTEERSWQDVAKQLCTSTVAGLGQTTHLMAKAAQTLGNGARYTATKLAATVPLAGLSVIPINSRFLGAVMGQTVHQGVCVGVSIYLREMIGEFLLACLRHLPKNQLMAIQIFSGAVQIALHRLRQYRERRSPITAARGFYNLSTEEWDKLSAEDQHEKIRLQQRHSDSITLYHIASLMTNLGLSANSEALGNQTLPAYMITWDAKVAVYTAVRDTLQGLFSMVSMDPPKRGIGGLTSPHGDVAGNLYSLGNAITNTAVSILQPKELAEARHILASQSSHSDFANALATINKMAGIKTLLNIILEVEDCTAVTEQMAQEAGVEQYWQPKFQGKRQDMLRILDHSITRLAVIHSNVSIAIAANTIATKLALSEQAIDALTNLTPAVVLPLQYLTVGRTWVAEAAVREELDSSHQDKQEPESSSV